jgi:molybdopterin converting factor subunit 1
MQIRVRLFAILKDRAGTDELTLSLKPGTTARQAADAIAMEKPLKDFLSRVAYAVNRSYVSADTVLNDGDELALIPPVSGG